MLRAVDARIERWALRAPFRIARGTRTETEVVTVSIAEAGIIGRGESTPTARYGETPDSVMAQVAAATAALRDGADRHALQSLLPPGAARNAIDAALWDLDAKRGGEAPATARTVLSAQTLSIDTPDAMAVAARKLGAARLVKIKVDANDPAACLRAVRANLPETTLIVDANEGWTMPLLARMQPVLAELRITFLEQPLPAREDEALAGFEPLVPICADESCHVAADVERLRGRYGLVNIKLDKTGGLTEALALLSAARGANMGVMVGCMHGTSLSIAPALRVAALADYADLDGPWWLAEDRDGGVLFAEDGAVSPPRAGFWGDAG